MIDEHVDINLSSANEEGGKSFKGKMVDKMLQDSTEMSNRRVRERIRNNFSDLIQGESDYSIELLQSLPLTHRLEAIPVEQNVVNRYTTGDGWKPGFQRQYEKVGEGARIITLVGGESIELSRCDYEARGVWYEKPGAKPSLKEYLGTKPKPVMKITTHNSQGELIQLPRICFYGRGINDYDIIDEDYIPDREERVRKEIERFMGLFKSSDIIEGLLPEKID